MVKERIILGIDPGTNIMGYGIILVEGRVIRLLEMGVLKMKGKDEQAIRLREIFQFTTALIDKWHPDELAAEAPFFGKNVQSMLKLGRAQGVALAAALNRGIPVAEYAPRTIKQSITGRGAATKEQVASMLQRILNIQNEQMPEKMDATDGLAAAVCHYFQSGRPTVQAANSKSQSGKTSKKVSGWQAFITQHPDRIKKRD